MTKKSALLILLVLLLPLVLTGCIPGDGTNTQTNPAGFFWGIWHGWVAPISLVIGLFRKGIRVYETANQGLIYDFGFYIAVISGFGGLSLFRGRNKDRDK